MKTRIQDAVKLWCVYVHFTESEIFYVGSGRPGRPMHGGEGGGRSTTWNRYVRSLKSPYFVQILDWFDTRAEALVEEQRMISELIPACNRETFLRFGVPRLRMPGVMSYLLDRGVSLEQAVCS